MASMTAQRLIEKTPIYLGGKPSDVEPRASDEPALLAHRISELASELDRDFDHVERKRLLAEIRQIRRSLVTLESDLVTTDSHCLSDAC